MSFTKKSIIAVTAVAAMSAGFWLSLILHSDNKKTADNSTKTAIDSAVNNKRETEKEAALANARNNFSPIQGSILTPPRKIAIPALIKDNKEAFSLADLTGHWSLLFFGYTHCPDVCPVTMGVVAQAKKIATANNHIFPQLTFVSIDPERDKVETLAEYVQYFDKDFIGVTGDKDLIKALALQMSVIYMKMPAEGDSGYLVDHSAALLLLNPEGKLVAFFNPPHDPNTILKDFQTVVNLSN